MNVLATARLTLRWLTEGDAGFIVRLLNERSFLDNIGDRGVRTLDDGRAYIERMRTEGYERTGLGMYAVVLARGGDPIGVAGLLDRDGVDGVEIGYALLPEHWRRGYASEAGAALMEHGRERLGLDRIVAITARDNHASKRLLTRLGLRFARLIRLPGDDEEIELFEWKRV